MPETFPTSLPLPHSERRSRDAAWLGGLAAALLLAALTAAGWRPGLDLVPPADSGAALVEEVSSLAVSVEEASTSSLVGEAPAAAEADAATTTAPAIAERPPLPAAPAPQASPADSWRAEGILLVTDGQAWDAASLANVDAALAQLPPAVRAGLGNRALGPLHILVNSEGRSLSGKQPYGGAANFFSTNDGVNELVLYAGQSVATVLHELGHAYNLRAVPAGRYALVLLEPEMASFMASTGWSVVSSPNQVRAAVDQTQVAYGYEGGFTWPRLSNLDPLEDFANSFALYFLDAAQLRQLSPERFDWFAANLPR